MAGFVEDIQGPSSVWMIGRGAEAPKSVVGGLADAIGGAIDKGIDIYRNVKGNNLEAAEGDELSQAVRDYANGPQTPPLVGQQTNPAENDPGFQAAKAEMNTHAAAAAQGSPGAKQALLTRLSEIQSRYASQNPYYAPDLAKHAQSILGFNANAELFQTASAKEDLTNRLVDSTKTAWVKEATDSGVPMIKDQNGNPDMEAYAEAGRQIAYQKGETDRTLQQLQLEKEKQGPSLTDDQLKNQQFTAFQPVVQSIFNSAGSGIIADTGALLRRIEGAPTPQQRAAVFHAIGVAETQATSSVMAQMARYPQLSPATRDAILNEVKQQFAPLHTLADGDFSTGGLLGKTLTEMVNGNKVRFHEVAPGAAAFVDTFGAQNAAGAFSSAVGGNTQAFTSLQQGAHDVMTTAPSVGDTLGHSAAAGQGRYDPSIEQNPAKQASVVKQLTGVIKGYNAQGQNLDTSKMDGYANSLIALNKTGLRTGDPQQLRFAAANTNTPQAMATFEAFAKSYHDPGKVAALAQSNLLLNNQSIEMNAGVIERGGKLTIPGNQGNISVTYSAHVDQKTGEVRFDASANLNGKRAVLTPDQTNYVMQNTKEYRQTIDDVNASRRAVQFYQEHAIPDVDLSGKPQQQTEAEPTRVEGKLGDMIDQVADDAGVDKRLAHAFALEESSGGRPPQKGDISVVGAGNKNPFQVSHDVAQHFGQNEMTVSGSVYAGIHQLRDLWTMFDGDEQQTAKVAIAYIAGVNNVDKVLANPGKYPRTVTGVNRILKMMGESPLEEPHTIEVAEGA